jgi:hypothetical protein
MSYWSAVTASGQAHLDLLQYGKRKHCAKY